MPLDASHYDRASGAALAELNDQVRSAWRLRYLAEDGVELRAVMLLERAEAQMLAAGRPATIRDLWMAIADQAAVANDLDVRAAAALAGLAMGLRSG